jgi:hypothetical protein
MGEDVIRALVIGILLSLGPDLALASQPASCASDAISRAKPLLAFHFGEDDRIDIDQSAKELPEIRNPANAKQRFKVYEVWGYLYKGRYRMHFIYFHSAQSGCVLMGQEILEYASL